MLWVKSHGIAGKPQELFEKQQKLSNNPIQFPTLGWVALRPAMCRNSGRLPPSPMSIAPSLMFDVFLCHNSMDKLTIRSIAAQLRDRGISYWLDEEQLPPGCNWLETQERDMAQLKAAAVFIGKHSIGKYQDLERAILVQEYAKHRQLCIIPVFLPDAPPQTEMPKFLGLFTWVDFRRTDVDPMEQLIQGITLDPPDVNLNLEAIAQEIKAIIPNNLTLPGAIAFVGRDQALADLHALLQQENPVSICAVAGMGSIGKTELALQYVVCVGGVSMGMGAGWFA
jgi:TIR domain